MVRLKFLLFALVVLCFWTYQLFLLAPTISAQAVDQAAAEAKLAPTLVNARLDERRMEIQKAALKVAGSPALLSAFPASSGKGRSSEVEAPDADRMREVRSAVSPVVPEAFRRDFVVALVNDAGAIYVRGDEDPKALPPGLDAAALAKAGGDGLVHDAFGVTHVFYSFPVALPDRSGEARAQATVVVGAPLVATGLVPDLAKETGLGAVVLLKNGKVLSSAGPENALAETAEKALKDGQTQILSRGYVLSLGTWQFPALTQGDTGEGAALAVGARKQVPGTPFEAVGIVSTKPAVSALATFQRMSLLGLLGLVGLSAIFAILMGGAFASPSGSEVPARPRRGDTLGLTPTELPPMQQPQPMMAVNGGMPMDPQGYAPPPMMPVNGGMEGQVVPFQGAPPPAPAYDFAPPPVPPEWDSAPPPMAQGDWSGPHAQAPAQGDWSGPHGTPPADFFNNAPPPTNDFFASAPSAPPPVPADSVFAPPTPPPSPLPNAQPSGVPSFDSLTTRAYPVPTQADIDSYSPTRVGEALPFSQENGAVPLPAPPPASSVETTRVSAIPEELLRQTAQPSPLDAVPLPGEPRVVSTGSYAAAAPEADSEEAHFQDVYRDFVATREKCGEPADGLTYDKFVQKLRKNKEQLMQKYTCKTVRFTVYVKDGKAALKATPVKE